MSIITVDYGTIQGGGGADVFTLSSDLAQNSYVDFTVKSSTYKAIGFRGNTSDLSLRFSYFNTDSFTNGVFGKSGGAGTSGSASFLYDSDFFSFPNSTTMRFTNSQMSGGMKAGTTIIIVY